MHGFKYVIQISFWTHTIALAFWAFILMSKLCMHYARTLGFQTCSSIQFSCVGAMASWGVQDLLKEIADMEVISMRNPGSDLLPKMQQALVSKIECTHLITPSNYVKIMDCLEKSTLPEQIKQALSTSFETKCAAGVQGPVTLQIKPRSMTMPRNYLCRSGWEKIQAQGCPQWKQATS